MIRLGKTLYLRFGNFLRRVPIEKVRPDYHGEVSVEEGYAEPNDDEERFTEEETPVKNMAKNLDLAEKNKELNKQLIESQEKVSQLQMEMKEENEKLNPNCTEDIDLEGSEENKAKVIEAKKLKRKLQKDKKAKEKLKLPATGTIIIFREKGSEDWISGRIVASFKKTSIYKYCKHVLIGKDLIIQKDFEKDIDEWNEVPDEEKEDNIEEEKDYAEPYLMIEDDTECVFPVKIIPTKEYNRPEVQEAMQAEILKYKSFNAFKEVQNVGQPSIPIKWVVTEQKEDGKNQPYKARMCIRGDLEKGKENIRSDSPTASKETLKLALIIAANEGFKIKSVDVKSAFLQGCQLEREIFVRPPPEANTEGKLWQLLQGAYGISDGRRLFYLKV